MNPETEAILKALGFVAGDSKAGRDDGMLTFLVPRTPFQIRLFPTATPASVLQAIWAAGGEARLVDVVKARSAYLASLGL